MGALLFVPAAPLGFAAFGALIRVAEAARARQAHEAGRRLVWAISLAAGAVALISIGMGRPA